jgi:hypothetical protein
VVKDCLVEKVICGVKFAARVREATAEEKVCFLTTMMMIMMTLMKTAAMGMASFMVTDFSAVAVHG